MGAVILMHAVIGLCPTLTCQKAEEGGYGQESSKLHHSLYLWFLRHKDTTFFRFAQNIWQKSSFPIFYAKNTQIKGIFCNFAANVSLRQ